MPIEGGAIVLAKVVEGCDEDGIVFGTRPMGSDKDTIHRFNGRWSRGGCWVGGGKVMGQVQIKGSEIFVTRISNQGEYVGWRKMA